MSSVGKSDTSLPLFEDTEELAVLQLEEGLVNAFNAREDDFQGLGAEGAMDVGKHEQNPRQVTVGRVRVSCQTGSVLTIGRTEKSSLPLSNSILKCFRINFISQYDP